MMIFLDIETSSLDADTGTLVAVGTGKKENEIDLTFVKSYEDEKTILIQIFEKIKNKTIITFNGKRFDIPFLITRGLKYNLIFPKVEIIDLFFWSWKYLRLQSKKLHDICVYCDIEHEEVSGREVNELYIRAISGDDKSKERILKHLYHDVKAMMSLYDKLEPMIKNYPSPEEIFFK